MSRKLISSALGLGFMALTASAQQPPIPATPPLPQPGQAVTQPGQAVTQPGQTVTQPGQPGAPPGFPAPGQPGQGLPGAQPGRPGMPPAAPKTPGVPPAMMPAPLHAGSTNPTDALVQAVLARDPDVKLAQAKLAMAEAEVAKARQAVTLKVMTLNASVQELKSQLALQAEILANHERLAKANVVGPEAVNEARHKFQAAQNALAVAEMELKLLTGGESKGVGSGGVSPAAKAAAEADEARLKELVAAALEQQQLAALRWLAETRQTHHATGPIPERVRVALDKVVKLAPKGEKVTFEKALETFKAKAGLDVPIRFAHPIHPITSEGEEMPVGAWIQLFTDEDPRNYTPPGPVSVILVREYGLLVTYPNEAPPGALGIMDLWKQPLKKDGSNKSPGNPPQKTP